jgi:hypothetical protein
VPLFELPSSFSLGNDLSGWFWDVTPDGERFLISARPPTSSPPLTVEWDWRARSVNQGAS